MSIPAFYLHLAAPELKWWRVGSGLYLLVSISLFALLFAFRRIGPLHNPHRLDMLIALGSFGSIAGNIAPWTMLEWAFRLILVVLIVIRLAICLRPLLKAGGTAPIWILAAITLFLSGLGFYLLEPTVNSYADGLWLAFVSGATVGYGDIVPTTPASRVFAVFMVLLGYAMLSLVTASIAAIFVGEDEKKLRREMHRDIQSLQAEVRRLRESLGIPAPSSENLNSQKLDHNEEG
jgi:voltage-gated potassium channel